VNKCRNPKKNKLSILHSRYCTEGIDIIGEMMSLESLLKACLYATYVVVLANTHHTPVTFVAGLIHKVVLTWKRLAVILCSAFQSVEANKELECIKATYAVCRINPLWALTMLKIVYSIWVSNIISHSQTSFWMHHLPEGMHISHTGLSKVVINKTTPDYCDV